MRVPGLQDGRVADLKYADDVVAHALARSRNGLRRQLRRMSRWGGANGMRVGAHKCGIMVGTSVMRLRIHVRFVCLFVPNVCSRFRQTLC